MAMYCLRHSADIKYALKSIHTPSVHTGLTAFIHLVRRLIPSVVGTYSSPSRAQVVLVPHRVMPHPQSSSGWRTYRGYEIMLSVTSFSHTHFVASI